MSFRRWISRDLVVKRGQGLHGIFFHGYLDVRGCVTVEHGSFILGSEFACTMYISYFFAMQATSSVPCIRLCENHEVYVTLYY